MFDACGNSAFAEWPVLQDNRDHETSETRMPRHPWASLRNEPRVAITPCRREEQSDPHWRILPWSKVA